MKGQHWCVLLACLICVAVSKPADACIGPGTVQRLEATAPSSEQVDVGLSPTILVQFSAESGYPQADLFDDLDQVPLLTLTNLTTGEVIEPELLGISPVSEGSERSVMSWSPTLEPGTAYSAMLEQSGNEHVWEFTTGSGEAEPFAPTPAFEITASTYFGDWPVSDCCPEQFVGECPRCFVIGYEPLATIEADFETLAHPAGPGAFVYTLQRRENSDGSTWDDVAAGSFEFEGGSLKLEDSRIAFDDVCVRVIARSVVEPILEYESNEECRRGEDHFGDPPQREYDSLQLSCGDDEVVDEDVDEDVDEEESEDDDVTDEDDGWEFDEGGDLRSSDSGCGCSSTRDGAVPGSLLLIALALIGRRRLHPRRARD